MVISLGVLNAVVDFEVAGGEVVAVDSLVCADLLEDVVAEDEAIAHLDVAEVSFSHGDLLGLTRNETAEKPRALSFLEKGSL